MLQLICAAITAHNCMYSTPFGREKGNCPLRGECQPQSIVFAAEVTEPCSTAVAYNGMSEPPFRQIFASHLTSLCHPRYRNSTEMSKHVWNLKEQEKDFSIAWRIIERARPYDNISKRCGLCLAEKLRIITSKDPPILNSGTELISKCRHANKFKLSNYSRVT